MIKDINNYSEEQLQKHYENIDRIDYNTFDDISIADNHQVVDEEQCPFCLGAEVSREPLTKEFWGVICADCNTAYIEKVE